MPCADWCVGVLLCSLSSSTSPTRAEGNWSEQAGYYVGVSKITFHHSLPRPQGYNYRRVHSLNSSLFFFLARLLRCDQYQGEVVVVLIRTFCFQCGTRWMAFEEEEEEVGLGSEFDPTNYLLHLKLLPQIIVWNNCLWFGKAQFYCCAGCKLRGIAV